MFFQFIVLSSIDLSKRGLKLQKVNSCFYDGSVCDRIDISKRRDPFGATAVFPVGR